MKNTYRVDLHTHTTFSDGTLTPVQLLDHAQELGLDFISITDHDTLTSTPDILDLARQRNITLIPGIEFSAVCEEIPVHILGYFVDRSSKRVVSLLNKAIGSRTERNQKIIDLLSDAGMNVSWEDLRRVAGSDIIGRPHFAKILVEKDYARNISHAFQEYLADNMRCCPKRRELPTAEVIDAINESGGIACLAHPNVYGLSTESEFSSLLKKLKAEGLKGLEVFNARHNKEKSEFFLNLAKQFNLLPLGGSDFHGENKKNVFLGKFYGIESIFETIKDLLQQRGLLP